MQRARRHDHTSEGPLAAVREALGAGGTLHERMTDRLAHAHDASHFHLVPSAVARPHDAAAVGRLFAAARSTGLPLTFRSGGTSLSGQAGTTGLLVDTRSRFRSIEVLDSGHRVRVGPGATIRQVNARLLRHGRKLGPDPASEVACTVGGVVANNSSGMACGTTANSYATLESMVLVLPSGTVVDTGAADADAALRAREPELYAGLCRLRDRVRESPDLRARVERQFSMKNTMGYGINSLLDFRAPADILAHLVVGSEGTLAFIASIVLRTVPVLPHTRTGLLVFEDLAAATGALPGLVDSSPVSIELLDATSLRVGQRDPAADERLRTLPVDEHAALLVEYQAATADGVDELALAARATIGGLPIIGPDELTADPAARAGMWHIRKGLYAMVAEARPAGTTALLEDVVVPVPQLLPTCERLTSLFRTHGYSDAVIFGHAKDGNIHFMLTEQLAGEGASLDRFARFTDDMVDLVLGQGGSLKAEHGTGRMMAPFVRRQYGDELYAVMREIKRLCDPEGVLNPGVLLSEDADIHLRDLKTTPPIEPEADRCVECGFCEPVCPSRDLTTTPRQRIVLRREIERARRAGDVELADLLEADYDYDGVETCAADGMCQTTCPVLINTGDLVKRLRADRAGRATEAAWTAAGRRWDLTTRAASAALTAAAALPTPVVEAANRAGRRVAGPDALPLWSPELPRGGHPSDVPSSGVAQAVFFPSCTGTMFGPATPSTAGSAAAFALLCERAGVGLVPPPAATRLCCGTPWRSKGLTRGYQEMADRVLPALWQATRRGELPVVLDASSCTEGVRQMVEHGPERFRGITVVDAVEFCATHLLPRLTVTAPVDDLALHPTCSATRMGLTDALQTVAGAVATSVTVPQTWGCCGFAGDRGLLHPELTASATRAQAAEITAGGHSAFASCNRTCELGMTRATGQPYVHVLELVEQATRP
ncbi:FAD-binding and (Fe-S)-binding domain-containing protein [Pseudonocardia sp. WMMC193]|uniref:FAD-binding and (Fe-S)-binding domain-containing protein n=1 Tax=Pseudonocardia sp. WMMC193 TaxID=2911965 RepID=UPI001F1893DA|nr:FAD-binding and (Fe-S)-binding domain-containing protein [Pseudonocardia sp. WMMC193]MCF7549363.1 FAD-binding oxidoreductase [Pseudonocardia sp. WMMC193]